MFGKLVLKIVQYLIAKKYLFASFFLLLLFVLGYGVSRLKLQEDIYSIFPAGEKFQQFNEILQQNNLNKQLVFSIAATENYDSLDSLVARIESKFSKELKNFQVYRTVDEKKLIAFLQAYAVTQLDSSDYSELEKRLQADRILQSIQADSDRLSGSSGFFLRKIIAKDPLGIANEKLAQFSPDEASSAYKLKDGLLFSKDGQRIFFFADVKINLKNSDSLLRFDTKLKKELKTLNAENKGLQLTSFGSYQISVENARQVKADTSITMVVVLVLILLLLIVYYRSILAPLYFLFPALFGMLFGAGVVGFFHPNISAISMATSSILLGIVLDYSFHFFTHFKHTANLFQTVREISAPLVIGSFTTIMALAALLFTNSNVLQNFGLIALCTLSGSVIFTLFFLPVFLSFFKLTLPNRLENTSKTKKHARPFFLKVTIILVAVLSVVFLWNSQRASFDSDLNNLAYFPKGLQNEEFLNTGFDGSTDKRLFIISSANSEEKALERNAELFQQLSKQKEQLAVRELLSVAPYLTGYEKQTAAQTRWLHFWSSRKERVWNEIQNAGKKTGFSDRAFLPFQAWMNQKEFDFDLGKQCYEDLTLSKLKYEDKDEVHFITRVVLPQEKVAELKKECAGLDGVYVLDMRDLTQSMVEVVQADFNYLLLFSSLLVFFSLLLVYGRIELALFAFFPMVLAWIWILGITGMLDIKFNFVNIILASFIFGLGDDFSIFITDGLIQKHRYNSNQLSSYRSAILLSGWTTIIGTGALIFAKHPAVQSIALVSVIGIGSVMFITLYLQTPIFNFFVSNRVRKKRVPVSLFVFIYSMLLFSYFFVGSLLLSTLVIFILFPLPIAKEKKRNCLNYLISRLAKSTLFAGFHIRKRIVGKAKLNFDKPSIIVANHSSFLDILAVLMLNPKTIIMVKKWVYNSPVFGLFIRYAGYPFAEEDVENNVEFIKGRIDAGYSIVLFPEGTRSEDGKIHRFHKGAFYLAEALDLEIQPLLILGTHEVNPKNDFMINSGEITVCVLDRMSLLEGENYSHFAKRVQREMRSEFARCMRVEAKSSFWKNTVLKNYLYKGPVLEWYTKIKWKLEAKHFDAYDEKMGDRKVIYDIGCGYGYLSFFLHYKDNDRILKAFDLDVDKIKTAQQGMHKNANLNFEVADLSHVEFEPCDVVFLNDTLHYLLEEEQKLVLERIANALNPGGILFIREGITDWNQQMKRTKWTEILSTKWFKFNQTKNELHFISKADIAHFAKEFDLKLNMESHSKISSNVLFTLEKADD